MYFEGHCGTIRSKSIHRSFNLRGISHQGSLKILKFEAANQCGVQRTLHLSSVNSRDLCWHHQLQNHLRDNLSLGRDECLRGTSRCYLIASRVDERECYASQVGDSAYPVCCDCDDLTSRNRCVYRRNTWSRFCVRKVDWISLYQSSLACCLCTYTDLLHRRSSSGRRKDLKLQHSVVELCHARRRLDTPRTKFHRRLAKARLSGTCLVVLTLWTWEILEINSHRSPACFRACLIDDHVL